MKSFYIWKFFLKCYTIMIEIFLKSKMIRLYKILRQIMHKIKKIIWNQYFTCWIQVFKGCIFLVKLFALWRNHMGCIKISLKCSSSFSLRMWFSCGCKIPLLWIQSATAHVETAATTQRKSAESNISPFLPFVCGVIISYTHNRNVFLIHAWAFWDLGRLSQNNSQVLSYVIARWHICMRD